MFTTLEHLRPIVASITTLIGNCETMEATYCVGTDVDVCRMFDQYLYKVRHDFLFPKLGERTLASRAFRILGVARKVATRGGLSKGQNIT